eukprot:3684843-Prymnesium_polylepis.3
MIYPCASVSLSVGVCVYGAGRRHRRAACSILVLLYLVLRLAECLLDEAVDDLVGRSLGALVERDDEVVRVLASFLSFLVLILRMVRVFICFMQNWLAADWKESSSTSCSTSDSGSGALRFLDAAAA